jgi:hypothetical protein
MIKKALLTVAGVLLVFAIGVGGGVIGANLPAVLIRAGYLDLASVQIDPVASGEYVTQRPVIRAVSPDENAYMDFYTKGNGAFVFRGFDGGAHAFVAYAQTLGGENFLEAHGTVGPPELRATGPADSVDLMLRPQGDGVVLARNGVQLIAISETGEQTTLGSFADGVLSLLPVVAPKAAPGSALVFLDKADGLVKVRYGNGQTVALQP